MPAWNMGFPCGTNGKGSACNVGDLGSVPESGRFLWRWAWQPTPIFFPGDSHGQGWLVGYSPWGSQKVRHNWVTSTFTFQHGAFVDHMLLFNPPGTPMLSHHNSTTITAQINPMEEERMKNVRVITVLNWLNSVHYWINNCYPIIVYILFIYNK